MSASAVEYPERDFACENRYALEDLSLAPAADIVTACALLEHLKKECFYVCKCNH